VIGSATERFCSVLALCISFFLVPVAGQQSLNIPEVPSHFKLDVDTAARLRPQLMAHSIAASELYAAGILVFDRLLKQVPDSSRSRFAWQLRIVEDSDLNAYSSPDGSVYVENGLARLADPNRGLWAAILSHEISHIVRRDWARRYLFQKYLENGSGSAVVLGDPTLPSPSWSDSEKASADMGRFSRQLELEADREGLILMARAGYHPDFVPTLHHLLQARGSRKSSASPYAMHPCWEDRDHELIHDYVATSIEFEHLWPEWYASPGGNPPVVVFTERPSVKRIAAKEWQIQIPMHCQNLVGAVEVVLLAGSTRGKVADPESIDSPGSAYEERQLTGCTSPKTTVVFNLSDTDARQQSSAPWTDIYVLDAWGSVLARADVPKLPR
jgi:hypothetical protein